MSDSVQPHRRQPTRLLYPQDSPGKNTGVGCHFLLQCRKVKIESEVAQSCPALSDPMDCSLPGSSVHGIFQARVLEWGAIAFSMANLDSILKSRDITLSTKFHLVKAMVFPIVMYRCESWTIKNAEREKERESHSVVSDSLRPHRLYSPWNSPDQNTGVLAFPFSRGSSQPRDQTQVSCTAGGFFTN